MEHSGGEVERWLLLPKVPGSVGDSGGEVERRLLLPEVPGSNHPVLSGFCLWDFYPQTA